jgi:hypothetical protein
MTCKDIIMLLLQLVTKSEMLKILQATNFPKNTGRTNVLTKGQTFSQSMVLGKVRKLYSSCNGKICLVEPRHNKKNQSGLKGSQGFIQTARPRLYSTSGDDK